MFRLAAVPLSPSIRNRGLGQPLLSPPAHRSPCILAPLRWPLWTAMFVPGAKIPLPLGFIPTCLPSPSQKAPSGSAWVHEIKHDGLPLDGPKGWQSGQAIHPTGLRLVRQVSPDSRGASVPTGQVHHRGRGSGVGEWPTCVSSCRRRP
jgi:hypothetical protein